MSREIFDRLFDDAVEDLIAGRHAQDEPPREGGRWPVTVVSLPSTETAMRLQALMHEVLPLAGPGHFLTGRADSVHLTVRALETYRDAASPDEPVARAWVEAVRRTADACAPFVLDCTGLTITRGSVMAQLQPRDDRPWRLMGRLRDELGEQAWFEDKGPPRDLWYANLVHLAAPVADPVGLVEHVRSRRSHPSFPVVVDSLFLVRYRYREGPDGRLVAPETWLTAPLSAGSPPGL